MKTTFYFNNKIYNINYGINSRFIKLLDKDSFYLGIYKIKDALLKANKLNIDLIELSNESNNISVCKLISLGRFKYLEIKKKSLFAKKNIKHLKEIKFNIFIAENDYNNKLKKIKNLLSCNYKVKVCIFLKGREIYKHDIMNNLVNDLIKDLEAYGILQNLPKLDNKYMVMYFLSV